MTANMLRDGLERVINNRSDYLAPAGVRPSGALFHPKHQSTKEARACNEAGPTAAQQQL
jgi:hypothetical protein